MFFFYFQRYRKFFSCTFRDRKFFLKVQKIFLNLQKIFPHSVFFLNLRCSLTVCVFWNGIVWICDHLRIEKYDSALQNQKIFALRALRLSHHQQKLTQFGTFLLDFRPKGEFFFEVFSPEGRKFFCTFSQNEKKHWAHAQAGSKNTLMLQLSPTSTR